MNAIVQFIRQFSEQPRLTLRFLRRSLATIRGYVVSENYADPSPPASSVGQEPNPLRAYFDAHSKGPGIWKFNHYFDIYHRHFSKFRGRPVRILEIGIYSGGSLKMWKDYFGPECTVYGIDIAPECKVYEDARTKIFIGDQGDRDFWKRFKKEVPPVDLIIDDGAHTYEEQVVTLEEMLPHIRPGGVYLCEDVQGSLNHFTAYCHALSHRLNDCTPNEENTACRVNPLQDSIDSIHHYPFVVVIEKAAQRRNELRAPKHGTEWQPFYRVESEKQPAAPAEV